MKPIKAVLFDLDDTLVDDELSTRTARQAVSLAIAALRPGVAAIDLASTYEQLAGVFWSANDDGLQDLDQISLRLWQEALALNGESSDELAQLASAQYIKARGANLFPIDGATKILSQLSGVLPLAVITNGPGDIQRDKLALAGFQPYFALFLSSQEFGAGKPDPRIFQHAVEKLGVLTDAAIHVGDSLSTDIAGANAAGVTSVWLNRKGLMRTPLDPVPDYEISSLSQLPALLGLQV